MTEFMASAYGADLSPEEQEKKYAEEDRQREELVAQCMKEEGFEYKPNVQSFSFSEGSAEEWNPDSREWVSQYGYGMVNFPGREETDSSDATEYEDVNADYAETLSESERTAFYEALYGPAPDEEDMPADGEAVEWDWSTAGCSGWAQHERDGDNAMTSDEHKPLMDAMNTLWEDAMSAPEISTLNAEWAACMADAGHPGFSAQQDAQNSINEKMNAAYENSAPTATATSAASGETAPAGSDEADMSELGKEEIELALADLDCREKTEYRDKMLEVQFKREQQFVDDHKAELEAFRADLEQGS
ncbi:hypothetical protein ACIQXM_09110 [Arthrobacter sp. NPDC097144]|uniref:hypothetical protein n=1 Tax=Arthrobacter sp. NPDC097144 TaxID=3363946 RepID=UPI003815F666